MTTPAPPPPAGSPQSSASPPPRSRGLDAVSPGMRLAIALVVGVGVGAATGFAVDAPLATLLGWTAAALGFVVTTWAGVWRMGPQDTAAHATREEPTRAAVHALLVVAAIASVIGVGVVFFGGDTTRDRVTSAAVAIGSAVASWAAIHTLFALTYARTYYSQTPSGIDFNQDDPPRYTDFAYVAFTVGMSYAISDTNLTSSAMRKVALGHALLSYLFGTVILAALINLVAGL